MKVNIARLRENPAINCRTNLEVPLTYPRASYFNSIFEADSDSDFEPDVKTKKSSKKRNCAEDDDDDDEDEDMICNTMLLTGSHGIGKTASVYALAHQLGFKVFEVNASSRRSGKQIMSQLQEVTQSMQVAKVNEPSAPGITSFFKKSKEMRADSGKHFSSVSYSGFSRRKYSTLHDYFVLQIIGKMEILKRI